MARRDRRAARFCREKDLLSGGLRTDLRGPSSSGAHQVGRLIAGCEKARGVTRAPHLNQTSSEGHCQVPGLNIDHHPGNCECSACLLAASRARIPHRQSSASSAWPPWHWHPGRPELNRVTDKDPGATVEVRLLVECAGCRTKFRPKRNDARFCSNRCRQMAYRQRGAIA